MASVLGAPCLLNVTHDMGKDGTTYANIASCMPLPKGMTKPDAVNPPVRFDLDDPDMKLFETFGQKLQATIMGAEEWLRRQRGDAYEAPSNDRPMVDDIPF